MRKAGARTVGKQNKRKALQKIAPSDGSDEKNWLGGGRWRFKFKSNVWIVERDGECVECRGLGIAGTPGGEDRGIILDVVEVVGGLITQIGGLVTLLFNTDNVIGGLMELIAGIVSSHLFFVGIDATCAGCIVEEESLVLVVTDLVFGGERLGSLSGLGFIKKVSRSRKKVNPSVNDVGGHGGGDKGMREAVLALTFALFLVEVIADASRATLLHKTRVLWR